MRTFSPAVATELNKKQGLEVQLYIGVEWADGSEVFYSSTDVAGARKSIVTISGLETTSQVEGASAAQSVTVVLSDTDGHLTQVLNNIDIHKRPAKVYLGFPGVPVDQAVVLIDGEINSEMLWDERDRSLTFSILSKIEGRLFGFAAEDGLFQDVDSRTRSTPWPFRFGTTCAYPAVEIRNGRTGILRIGQGVLDATIDAKICQAQKIDCPKVTNFASTANEPTPEQNLINAQEGWAALNNPGTDDPFVNGPETQFGQYLTYPQGNPNGTDAQGRQLKPDRECQGAKFDTLCQLYRDRANQLVYVNETLSILNGEDFPQGETIDIRIDDVVYTGVFAGEVFTIEKTDRRDSPTGILDCRDVDPLALGYRRQDTQAPNTLEECATATNRFELQVVGGAGDAWRKLGEIEDSGFKWLPAGSTVHLESTQKRVHIVSMVPGTVDSVMAYRTLGDTQQLTELPTDYYEVVTTDYGGLEVVEVHLDRALTSYPDEKWTDQVYVAFTSDVGPNPVDVIEWIVERYTDFTVDATSFASVKTKIANYPCNYYHASKTNVLGVLQKIAYEARCALIVTDNVVKLTYLSDEPDADKTFTDADLVAGSFKFRHTRTESLITSSGIQWQPWGASLLSSDTSIRNFTVQNNVGKYGFFERDYVYDTINNEDQALKTATFWSIRDSNTWRLVEFQTTIEHMDLELFDCIQLNVSGFPNTKVIVTAATVDPDNGLVTFECWTPLLSGTTEPYTWAWPARQNAGRPYPLSAQDIEAPAIAITPPTDHPLYIDDPNPPVSPTIGDRSPSDLDDSFPTTICQDANDPALIDAIEPIFERLAFPTDTAQQARNADEAALDPPGGGGGANTGEDPENVVCGRTSFESCVWEVTVQYATATSIAPVQGTGSQTTGCNIQAGPCDQVSRGARCGGPTFFWCRTFGSETMAQGFADSIQGQIDAGFCSWTTGTQGPVNVTGPIKRASDANDPTCQGLGNVQTGASQQ